jgi:chloramphenicol-sensitive protein RarD
MKRTGIWLAVIAYTLWGLLPIYWKWLYPLPAQEILAHRVFWSFVLLGLILAVKRHWGWIRSKLGKPETVVLFVASGVLLAANWFVYIWAVNAGEMVEASLGYFMNPLVNVLLGIFFFKEKLRQGQWLAFFFAAAGVLYLTFVFGRLPWIGLFLALSFGSYGLLRKKGSLNSLEGLFFETLLMVPIAFGYLWWMEAAGRASFGHVAPGKSMLMIGAGVVTTVPLLCFAAAARRIDLSLMGILQYIAPTLQFLLGVLVYGEPLTHTRIIGFIFIWIALLVFSAESLWFRFVAKKRSGAP